LDSLIAEFEADAEKAGHLAEARADLARSWYADHPHILSALRLSAGLSQAQLAERAGTSQSHIARIELGQNDPSTEVVVRIARALNVDEAVAFRAILLQRSGRGQKV
jgi:ribosome-binding protein aMBF1 (putative translation factor)